MCGMYAFVTPQKQKPQDGERGCGGHGSGGAGGGVGAGGRACVRGWRDAVSGCVGCGIGSVHVKCVRYRYLDTECIYVLDTKEHGMLVCVRARDWRLRVIHV